MIAYEKAIRGEKVQAMPFNNGKQQTTLSKDISITFKNAKPIYSNAQDKKDLKKWLENEIKEGRYAFSYRFINKNGVGHVLMLDKTQDKIRIHDPQSGKIYIDEPTFNHLINSVDLKQDIQLLRIDDLQFNEDKINLSYRKAD